jgi:hypothetical protein
MKTELIILLVFISQQISYTQDSYGLLKIPELNIHENNKMLPDSNRIKLLKKEKYAETPLHLGLDYGLMYRFTKSGFSDFPVHSLLGFFDFNIAGKVVYGKLEFGGLADRESSEWINIAALGLNYLVIKENRHLLYFSCGVGIGWGGWGVVLLNFNPRYVFMLNNFLGLSLNFRYMPQINYNQHFIQFSTGIQFFL